jgi:hypothetical protein
VLFGDYITREELLLVSKWLAAEKLTSGFDYEEALLAETVTAFGFFEGDVKEILLNSDSQVRFISDTCTLIDDVEWLLQNPPL